MDAITICAANYLSFAEVLGSSFLKHNSDSSFSILVIDAKKSEFSKNDNFNYLSPDDLEIETKVFENMSFYYDVTELATALKPSALKKLIKSGSNKVLYLDPDIQIFDELIELDKALDAHPIVLTPHTINPIPRDGLRPSEADIMASGTFNLGFIALAKSDIAESFLDWWEVRLRFDSISEPEEMLFTDQRWIDFVPSYFPFFVLREPGYNVAYWNLQERKLSKKGEKYLVNDCALKFFHFSGYRPEKPWILSKYVANNPRAVISEDKILAELCKNYGNLAIQLGWRSESAVAYGYANFESGKPIPSSLRRLYREDCSDSDRRGVTLSPPDDWQSWATKRSVESRNLSRILFSIWKSRPDLKKRFPDAPGLEASAFIKWAQKHGVQEKLIDEEFLNIGDLDGDEYPSQISNEKGINVAGYLSGELGLGQSARLIYRSALETKFPVNLLESNRSMSRKNEKIGKTEYNKIFPFTIAVVNADHFKFWLSDLGPKRIKHSSIVGVWAWEIEDFPQRMFEAFEFVDEIWAVSEFVKKAIVPHTRKPVFVIPTPIIAPEIIEKLNRSEIGLPERRKYNLFIFDYMSIFNRKNPLAVIEAHKKAFPKSDGPILVIKSTNGDKDAENREKLRFSILDRNDIYLIEDYLSRNQLNALLAECDCYISLHRSEGYGLTMAEAMALGKPVIATGYSGNLDFMNSQNSLLVPYSLKPVGPDSFPYSAESNWADPDIDTASIFIKKIFEDVEYRNTLGNFALKDVTEKFTIERAAEFIDWRARFNFKKTTKTMRSLKTIVKKYSLLALKFLKLAGNPRKIIQLIK